MALKSTPLFLGLLASLTLNQTGYSQSVSLIRQEIGYDRLVSELQSSSTPVPNGSGVSVAIVEYSASSVSAYYPNTASSEYSGVTFTNLEPSLTPTYYDHTDTVASYLVGRNSGIAYGVIDVGLGSAVPFVNRLLNFNGASPFSQRYDVVNQSFVADLSPVAASIQVNSAMDYLIARDRFTNVVGINNNQVPMPDIYAQSYNSITVGLTNGNHSRGTTTIGGIGRTKPDLVAPLGGTSYATAVVSSVAAVLHSAAKENANWVNAREPEVMKAIMMAGADKTALFQNGTHQWSNSTSQPLDSVYGAGEVDVYRSYHILSGGEIAGATSIETSNEALYGWASEAVDPAQELFWSFEIPVGQQATEVSILLTWNATFAEANGNFTTNPSSYILPDMKLRLFNINSPLDEGFSWLSDSKVDNVEHIYLTHLLSGQYAIGVTSDQASKFGLAWNVSYAAVPEPTSLTLMLGTSLFGAFVIRVRKKRLASVQCNPA